MTRQEHLQWCKTRALEYVEAGDLNGAYQSMVSDLGKFIGTENHPAIEMGLLLLMQGQLSNRETMTDFINGFN